MKKELTVVFPIVKDEKGFWILMGIQAPGKKLAGFRNGYGGKCEQGELPEDCAVREVHEEIGLTLEKEKLVFVGTLLQNEKKIFFYTYIFPNMFVIADNNEFVDNKWFMLNDYEKYIQEMLPGDIEIMQHVYASLESFQKTGKVTGTFEIDQSDNQELTKKTKKIFG